MQIFCFHHNLNNVHTAFPSHPPQTVALGECPCQISCFYANLNDSLEICIYLLHYLCCLSLGLLTLGDQVSCHCFVNYLPAREIPANLSLCSVPVKTAFGLIQHLSKPSTRILSGQ